MFKRRFGTKTGQGSHWNTAGLSSGQTHFGAGQLKMPKNLSVLFATELIRVLDKSSVLHIEKDHCIFYIVHVAA